MARADYKGNTSSAKNISILKNKFVGMRALIVSENYPELKELVGYFDLIIVESHKGLSCTPRPDLFIDTDSTPYVNHALKENRYGGLDNTLICINFKNLQQMKRARLRYQNYILAYMPTLTPATGEPKAVDSISFGVNESHPGVHIAKIGGCKEIYATYVSPGATYLDFNGLAHFIEEEEPMAYGKRRKNMLRPKRKLYLEENGI